MNFYISAKPKNGARAKRVGGDARGYYLTTKVMYCLFFPTERAAEDVAVELQLSQAGQEYIFSVKPA